VKKLLAFAEHDESQLLREFVKELEILSRLRHPNVLLVIGFCIEQSNQAIVSEFCSRGSVWNALHSGVATQDFTMVLRVQIAQQVAAAMAYLHANKVCELTCGEFHSLTCLIRLCIAICKIFILNCCCCCCKVGVVPQKEPERAAYGSVGGSCRGFWSFAAAAGRRLHGSSRHSGVGRAGNFGCCHPRLAERGGYIFFWRRFMGGDGKTILFLKKSSLFPFFLLAWNGTGSLRWRGSHSNCCWGSRNKRKNNCVSEKTNPGFARRFAA
jgi:hypothetical protein